MSETKFTKGPWVVFIDDSGDKWTGWPISITAPTVHTDCLIVRTGGQWPYEWDYAISQREAVANAHLIAAAPDMYEALEKCLNFITGHENEWGDTYLCGNAAREALAKARGETP